MYEKVGIVTVGVTASLMAAAPLASAHESWHSDEGASSTGCAFTGGTGGDARSGDATGALAGSGLNLGGTGGSNLLNIGDCSSFLNDNLNGNHLLSDNDLSL